MTQTRLASKLAGVAAQATPAPSQSTRLGKRATLTGARGEDVVLPELGRVYFELPGARCWQEVEAAVAAEMHRLGRGDLTLANAASYEVETALRVLAISAREPDDHSQAIGTLEQWGGLDNDVINIAWHAFGDVRERLDPISLEPSSDDMFAIAAAVKKKDARLLRTFGCVKLSAWLATTEEPQSTSPIPSSPSMDSPSES